MTIENVELLPAHIGATVVHSAEHATPERGKIVRWNSTYIFVMFENSPQPKACYPRDLKWWDGDDELGYPLHRDKDLVYVKDKIKIWVVESRGDTIEYYILFASDNQVFTLQPLSWTKEEAMWQAKMLHKALTNLTHHHKPGRTQIAFSYLLAIFFASWILLSRITGETWIRAIFAILVALLIKDLLMSFQVTKDFKKNSKTIKIKRYDA